MIWQFFLVGFLVLETAAYILRRHLAVALASHNRLVHGFLFLCVLYPVGLTVAFFTNSNLDIGWLNMLLLLAGGCIFPAVNLLAYRSNKDIDAGLFTILCNLTPIVTIIAATLLLNEGLNGLQLAGAAVIISSAFLATVPKIMGRSVSKIEGIGLALLTVFILGLAIVYERWMLTRVDLGAYFVYGWGAQTIWMAALAWGDRKSIGILREKKNFRPVLGFALATALKSMFFIAALKFSGNASLVVAFASFVSALVVFMAFFLLKERDHFWYKVGAAGVGVVGLVILNTA